MTTRSTAIVVTSLAGVTQVPIFTAPPGQVILVKSIYVLRAAGTAADVQILANRPGVAVVLIFDAPQVAAFAVSSATPWIVLEEGDQLLGTNATGTVFVWISGAKLPFP